MREVNGMSDLLTCPRSHKPPSPAKVASTAAHEWSVREAQVRAMIDSNGGSEQEGRSQPGKWRAVENGLAQRPSHEIDDCHHDEPERDDYLQWNRNALMLTPLGLEIIAEKAA